MNPFTQPLLKQAVIRKEDGKYKLYTKDGKRVLGTHDTRQEAIKQEYAIEKSQEKRANTKSPKAVIVKGSPTYITNNPKAEAFYEALAQLVTDAGYTPSFDAGEPYTIPDESAALWVGHSRGQDRLQYAPEGVKTLAIDQFEERAKERRAENAKLMEAAGYKRWADWPVETRPAPADEHYQVTDALRDAIMQLSVSQEKSATISGNDPDDTTTPIQRFDHGPDQPARPATNFQTLKTQPLNQQDRQALFQPAIKTPRPNEMRPVQTTGDRFTEATNRLFQREGYGEPVTDSGGYTRWGISQDAWPDEDIKNMTRERATEIYREHYWPKKLNEFPAIQEKMFDLRVNAGPRTNKWLQQSLLDAGGDIGEHGVDGHIGGDTLSALREADRGTIMELLINKQREEYERLRKADPEKYGDTAGWDERLKFNPREFY